MESLIDRAVKDYNYTSRYGIFPYYYHKEDDKYTYGITSWLNLDSECLRHDVEDTDTLDGLALKYYGRPDLFWVIADFNRIIDPYINLYDNFNFIYIPTLSGIRYVL